MPTKKFSLKDQLFNLQKVEYLAGLIKKAHPSFEEKIFIEKVVEKFPELELKERIYWIRENIKKFLPDDFQTAVTILLKSLPNPLDPTNTDNDFGDFIFAPISDFVAQYGCDQKNLELSLNALERMTQNFSCEDAIRFFLNQFPEQTLEKIKTWSVSKNYHVRRLASEGTRPKLPWCQKVDLDKQWVIENILENLFYDPTRFVIRSVANHLNDISKTDPELVVLTLKNWKQSGKQSVQKEIFFLISHALRTLVKKGYSPALELLGYNSDAKILVQNFSVHTSKVKVGETVKFSFDITAHQDEKLMIDYLVYFIGKNGKFLPPKTFKIKKIFLQKGEKISIEKKHPLRIMTTKKLYAGVHKVALQINGKFFEGGEFLLED